MKKSRYAYTMELIEAIEAILPPDTPYIFVAAHYEAGPDAMADVNLITTEDDNATLAASLRAIARKLTGDA